jgi:hypothetical protein
MRTRLVLVSLAAAALACTVENDASIQVRQVCDYPKPGSCVFSSGKCDQIIMDPPWIDLLARAELVLPIQWDNNLPDNSDASSGRLNTNVARVESYKMSYSASGLSIPDVEVAVVGAAVDTGASTVDDVLVMPFAITNMLLAATPVTVLVEVRAKGHLAGGTSFETAPLRVPVVVFASQAATAYQAALACTTGQVPKTCPDDFWGQFPATGGCVAPGT